MGVLRFFRRTPPIEDIAALATFIDEQASFLVQKGLYEYSRARAGHYAKVLFAEPEFRAAIEAARWRAYPLGLAMVGEMVEGVLRPSAVASDEAAAMRQGLVATVLSAFDRYPTPDALGAAEWAELRATLAGRLAPIGIAPPKRAIDVPEPYITPYFELMPIHAKLRASEFPTTRNYLRVSLCNIHDRFVERAAAPPLVAALAAAAIDS